jgi:hypothetical protein
MRLATAFLVAVLLSAGGCKPPSEHGLYRLDRDATGTTYGFSPHGPTFHAPPHWQLVDPQSQQRARLIRDSSDGAVGHCWFNVFTDPRYRGLSGEEILHRFHDPRSFTEMADTAALASFRAMKIHSFPAYESVWTSAGTARGIRVPLRARNISIAYKGAVVSSVCMASAYDSKIIATELDDIQLSFDAHH